jgi:uncharacterized protein (TIGR03437 family)
MTRTTSIRLGLIALAALPIAAGQAQSSAAVVGTGYSAPVPIIIAPGALTTIYVQGIGSAIVSPIFAKALPLPTKLGGISVSLVQTSAPQGPLPVPILAVFPVAQCRTTSLFKDCGKLTGINVQIPFEFVPNPSGPPSAPQNGNWAQLIVQEDGGAQATVEATPVFDRIHVLGTGDTLKNPAAANVARPIPSLSTSAPIVTHADGTLVDMGNQADVGETLTLWATGLGEMGPLPQTGQATPSPAPTGLVTIQFDYRPDAAPSLPTAGDPQLAAMTPGFVGLYQVNFVVPQLPPGYQWFCGICNSNLTVSIGKITSFDGAGICVRFP